MDVYGWEYNKLDVEENLTRITKVLCCDSIAFLLLFKAVLKHPVIVSVYHLLSLHQSTKLKDKWDCD